jgi:hypothetical protein
MTYTVDQAVLSWLIDWFDLFRVCPSRLCGSFKTYSYPTYARLYKSHRTTHMLIPYSALQTSKWSYWSCGTCRPLEVRRYGFPGLQQCYVCVMATSRKYTLFLALIYYSATFAGTGYTTSTFWPKMGHHSSTFNMEICLRKRFANTSRADVWMFCSSTVLHCVMCRGGLTSCSRKLFANSVSNCSLIATTLVSGTNKGCSRVGPLQVLGKLHRTNRVTYGK